MVLSERVDERLGYLRGKPLWSCGRAADVLWLQFGERHVKPSIRGGLRAVGDYSLHIQCDWQINSADGVIVESEVFLGTKRDKGTRVDEKLAQFNSKYCPRLVEKVIADENGGFQLCLEGGYRLSVVPDGSAEEQWRLLQVGHKEPHAVLAGHNLEGTG